jgi:hypothetical protein
VIIVVSGLPRSGTSLMMQMLAAGGLTPVTDGVRPPDEDNLRGYYEVEAVKQIRRNPAWIAQAEGKAIKVVSMLLFDLPLDRQYRIIFITRDMGEVLASQKRMLERRQPGAAGPSDAEMRGHFERHLAKVRAYVPASRPPCE